MTEQDDFEDLVDEYPFQEDTKSEEEKYTCSECGEKFRTERGLNIHQGQRHVDDA